EWCVRLYSHGRARGALEMGRHPDRHDEVRMIADEHVRAAAAEQPRDFTVQREKIAQVFFHEARRDQVVRVSLEPGGEGVGVTEAIVELATAGDLEHFGRQIDAVQTSDAAPS